MKQRLYIFLLFVIFYSCKKDLQNIQQSPAYLLQIKNALKDSLGATDFNNLVIEKAVLSNIESLDLQLLRIPFRGKKFKDDFLLLKKSKNGLIFKGIIVHLSDNNVTGNNMDHKLNFNGSMSLSSMNRKTVLHSNIQNGYIEAFHPQEKTFRTLSMQDPYQTLPEVIIVSTITTSGVSYSTWASLLSLTDGGGTNNYYGDISYNWDDYSGGGGGGYSGGSSDGGGDGDILTDPLYQIDLEFQNKKPAIDIKKYLNCFSAIPDAGATCSIEIFTDIPVDNDPNRLFSWATESPGHTFIQLKKKNGSNSVIQNIGFYPVTEWKSILSPLPINGKFVDNGEHEMNASLFMNLSPENFQRTLNQIAYVGSFVNYDIDEYNCTDFALEIFNTTRNKKIEIPKYDIPGGETPFGTNTPQGLYVALTKMKNDKDPEASNISIPGIKGWVSKSNGACN